MRVVYQSALWMPLFTALAAIGCAFGLWYAIIVQSYALMMPAGFGIFTFSSLSIIGWIVRKKMIEADLLNQVDDLCDQAYLDMSEDEYQAVKRIAEQFRVEIDNDMINKIRITYVKEQCQNQSTTTSQSS